MNVLAIIKFLFVKFIMLPQLLVILFLKTYRKFFSPLYGDVCRYFPTCSAYALEAVTLYGAVKGTWLSFKRVMRCNPFSKGGVDHVPEKKDRCLHFKQKPEIFILNHPPIDSGE